MCRSVLTATFFCIACGGSQAEPHVDAPPISEVVAAPERVAAPADANVNAVAWTQTSVEYATGTIQAYRTAMLRLDEGIADPTWTAAPEQSGSFEDLPPAVILDLDETVLDNSAYQAWLIATGGSFDGESWEAWCNTEAAGVVPGALEFVEFALERDVQVFFVSNRPHTVEEATRENLQALGFGGALSEDLDTVLLKHEREDWGSAKGTRRIVVAETHRVVLSIGDNLGDFVDGYKVSRDERDQIVADNAARWGTAWIVLPNPQYGSWEGTLHDFDYSVGAQGVFDAKLNAMETWSGP